MFPLPFRMPRHHFHFYFDPGAGTCLWSADEETRATFDYAVDLAALPLAPETRAAAELLVARFDTSIDWDNPGGPSPWSEEEAWEFSLAAAALLDRLRAELGATIDDHIQPRDGRPTSAFLRYSTPRSRAPQDGAASRPLPY